MTKEQIIEKFTEQALEAINEAQAQATHKEEIPELIASSINQIADNLKKEII